MQRLAHLMIIALLCTALMPLLSAAETNVTVNLNADNSTLVMDSPFAADSKVCVVIREWVFKLVMVALLLAFLLGVAIISFGAFPEWRDHGSKLILGSVGAAVLWVIGKPLLLYLMGVSSFCGL